MFNEFLERPSTRSSRRDWTERYRNAGGSPSTASGCTTSPRGPGTGSRAEPTFGQNQARVRRLAPRRARARGRRAPGLRLGTRRRRVRPPDLRGLEALLELRAEALAHGGGGALRGARRARGPAPGLVGRRRARASLGDLPLDLDLAAIEGAVAESLRFAGRSRPRARRGCARQRRTSVCLALARGRLPESRPRTGPSRRRSAPTFDLGSQLGEWVEESLTFSTNGAGRGLYLVEKDGGVLVGRREQAPERFEALRPPGRGERSFLRASAGCSRGRTRRTQIRFTTGYNTAQVVLGYRARDKNVRLTLTAGDFLYSIGEEDKEPEFDKVSWRFAGMRTRDGGLPGSQRGGAVDLKTIGHRGRPRAPGGGAPRQRLDRWALRGARTTRSTRSPSRGTSASGR